MLYEPSKNKTIRINLKLLEVLHFIDTPTLQNTAYHLNILKKDAQNELLPFELKCFDENEVLRHFFSIKSEKIKYQIIGNAMNHF